MPLTPALARRYAPSSRLSSARLRTPSLRYALVRWLSTVLTSMLSSRAMRVLAGRGLTSTRIARELSIDVKTVESHRTSAYRKLGVRSLAELKRLLGA